jgi:chromosome partitioning protein
MGAVVALLNQKGGVGKTSTCHHLAGTLARRGLRVLLLDNDPQASLTQGFFGPDHTASLPPSKTVAALYDDDVTPMPESLIRTVLIGGISLVPGSTHLTPFNMIPPDRWAPLERGMSGFLEGVRDDYDLTLIDNPPNLHLCSWASLIASDGLIVPLQPEDYGSQGLAPVRAAVASVQAGPNPDLRLLGFLVTMFDQRLAVHQGYDAILRESYGSAVFSTRVPRASAFVEAVASRQPISHYKPKSAAAKTMEAVADELLARLSAPAEIEVMTTGRVA